jgi:DNA-binding transcriptional LysR family regulator
MHYPDLVQLDQVEAFTAIVRERGFTRAAESLHLSQPAISRRIQLLEQELDAPLFERIPGGVVPTEAGRAFLPHAEALLASMRDAREAVRALTASERGSVTLAVVGTLASTGLTARLRAFREAHPAVDLRLRTALSAEVSALVRRGDATLGVRYDGDPHPELVSTPAGDERMVPVGPAGHRLAGRKRVAPAELQGERWLAFPPRSAAPEPYSSALARRLSVCGLDAAEILPIDSLTAQKRLAEAGFGLALLPESAVEEELRTGTLFILPIPDLQATIPVALIRRRHGFESGATRALLDLLSDYR